MNEILSEKGIERSVCVWVGKWVFERVGLVCGWMGMCVGKSNKQNDRGRGGNPSTEFHNSMI